MKTIKAIFGKIGTTILAIWLGLQLIKEMFRK
jgi:hypothetical protein